MFRFTLARLVAVLLAVALVAGACGGDDDATDTSGSDDGLSTPLAPTVAAEPPTPTPIPSPTPAPDTDNTDLSIKPLVLSPGGTPPTELEIEDVVEGSGATAASGDFAIMQYVGVNYSTNLEFDSSWGRGPAFSFPLGVGNVIRGWDQGIEGMNVGGRRLLTIPPQLAYGDEGSGSGSIAGGETLIFMVDLLGIASGEKPLLENVDAPVSELEVEDVIVGTGPTAAVDTIVWLHIIGLAQSTGEQFDATWDRGVDQAFSIFLNEESLLPGLVEGITGMQGGGRRKIVVPPELAFGATGAGDGSIAPDETLVFLVDLLTVVQASEAELAQLQAFRDAQAGLGDFADPTPTGAPDAGE